MFRKLSQFLGGSVCLLALSSSLFAQGAGQGIHGYLDPRTGAFHPLPRLSADATPPATSTFTGKFVFSYTITVDATIASSAKIVCAASATVEDNITSGNPSIFIEEASALATRSGSTATCTVNIPYSWSLATASTDSVTLGYTIEAPAEATVAASQPSRFSNHNLPSINVPATGTTTNETVTATF